MIYGKIFTKRGLFTLEKGRLRGDRESLQVCGTSAMSRKEVFSVLLGCKARHNVFKLEQGGFGLTPLKHLLSLNSEAEEWSI